MIESDRSTNRKARSRQNVKTTHSPKRTPTWAYKILHIHPLPWSHEACGKEFGEQLLYANMLERTTGLKMHSKLQPGAEAIERFGSQRTLSHPSVSAQNGQSVQAFQILGTKGDLSGTRLWRIEGPNWLQVRPRYVQLFDPSHTLSM
jgi:hypothetical protein